MLEQTRRAGRIATLLATALVATAAQAIDGDAERGRVKANTCLGCHAIPSYSNAYPNYHVPKVGGQNEEYLISALLAYRNGLRAHETMHNNALSLSDQDIADIAAFFSKATR
ncbi:MAG: cytochrome c [Gammaproteobacteria bacterium]|nr:cytochrome c [Gammaproteobacteria bacterium]MCB1923920.1 cytochrome c [Gammaproteobacteria bacterium]